MSGPHRADGQVKRRIGGLCGPYRIAAMRECQKGQMWSVDLSISILIFIIGSLISYMLISNLLEDNSYRDARAMALSAAGLLAGDGYYPNWTSSRVIRVGLRSDEHLSPRKMRELASLNDSARRSSLRITQDHYIYITNASNGTVPFFGACGIGALSVPSTPGNASLRALVVGAGTAAGRYELAAGVNALAGAVVVANETTDAAFSHLLAQDVIIIEGNISSVIGATQIGLFLDAAARRGITFIVIGDPGVSVLGITVNMTNVTNMSVPAIPAVLPAAQAALLGSLGLVPGDKFNVTNNPAAPVLLPTIVAIDQTDGRVAEFMNITIASSNMPLIATWIYYDARVWYFATLNGTTTTGGNLSSRVINMTKEQVVVSWPTCANPTPPVGAKQVAIATRSLPYHDELLFINTLVWRN